MKSLVLSTKGLLESFELHFILINPQSQTLALSLVHVKLHSATLVQRNDFFLFIGEVQISDLQGKDSKEKDIERYIPGK